MGRNTEELPNKVTTQNTFLPEDSDSYIPALGISWLRLYDITDYEIAANNILWSEKYQALIFPYFDTYKNLCAWQARNFNVVGHGNTMGKSKWFSQGNLKTLYHILYPNGTNAEQFDSLIVVEDIVSAVKVSRIAPAMPLFGSHVGLDRFKRLYNQFKTVKIWLDPDKRSEALKQARIGQQLGLKTEVIYSNKDPKECSDEVIRSSQEQFSPST